MQKPLKKAGKSAKQHKAAAPNKHGKGGKIEKKGEDDGHALLPSRLAGPATLAAAAPPAAAGGLFRCSLAPFAGPGRLSKAPKRAPLKTPHAEARELTKLIYADYAQRVAGLAAGAGGHLALVMPPVNATAADLQRKAPRPGIAWGASSQR